MRVADLSLLRRRWGSKLGILAILIGLALLFRLPYLLNPERMNSEHAFIGLQGLQVLQGRWSWFLWGSGYQAAWEPLVGALLFAIFGPSYSVLQAIPLLAFLGSLSLLFFVLQREIGYSRAFLLSLLCVFVGRPFLENNVLPYREWSNFFALLAFALAGGKEPKSWGKGFAAGFFPFFALVVDFCAIQYWVPLLAFLYYQFAPSLQAKRNGTTARVLPRFARGRPATEAASFHFGEIASDAIASSQRYRIASDAIASSQRHRIAEPAASGAWRSPIASSQRPRLASASGLATAVGKGAWGVIAGVFVGATLLFLTRWFLAPGTVPLAFSVKTFLRNVPLFFQVCFPGLLGLPAGFLGVGVALLVAIGVSGHFSVRGQGLSRSLRGVGLFGLAVVLSSLLGFWGSSMASDFASARYLQPLVYGAPLALAPLASAMRPQRLLFWLLPYLFLVGVGGWLQAAPYRKGPIPVADPSGYIRTAREMGEWMRNRGVRGGYGDYWTCYQLTFLFQEHPVIVPREPELTRYRFYDERVRALPEVGEVFTPFDRKELLEVREQELQARGALRDKWQKNGFAVLVRPN